MGSIGTAWNTLRADAVTLKKPLIASEQLRPGVAAARDVFLPETLASVALSDIVVLDETYVIAKFTRLWGTSRCGQRFVPRVPYGR